MKIKYITNRLIMRIFIGIFALVLLTSYMPFVNDAANGRALNNNFFFQISGSLTKEIKGEMCFDASIKKTNRGVVFSILRLDLENTKENKFVLIISKENTAEPIDEGTYRITNTTAKSVNHLDGVFGYLNIEDSDELPFYAERGEIIIKETNDDTVRGYLNISLENFNGEKITISGNFIANSLH